MTSEEKQMLSNQLVPIVVKKMANKVFSMSEEEAMSYGAFEETALTEQEQEEVFEEFLKDCFIKSK